VVDAALRGAASRTGVEYGDCPPPGCTMRVAGVVPAARATDVDPLESVRAD
jgi:hypothetical protein